MELKVIERDEALVVETHGPIDESIRDPLREQIHPYVATAGRKVVFDLTHSQRIDSQGLGNLVTLVAHANTNGSRVVFCGVPPFIAVVLSVTKLDRFFDLRGTLAEALVEPSVTG
ncbi:MAG: STAS domain-containing protein [Pirellulales bacterium]